MKVEEIELVHKDGSIAWKKYDLGNVLHFSGENFLLQGLFANNGTVIPANYYIGLDARETVSASDSMSDLIDEPIGNGYLRQPVSSQSGFTIRNFDGVYKALSNIVTFSAVGGDYNSTAKNIFLATATSGGTLISSVSLNQDVDLGEGESVNMRITMTLRNV